MSPRAVTPPIETALTLHEQWTSNKYSITSNGFLPDQAPLRSLPDPYYRPWEALIQNLQNLLEKQTLRCHVDQLPVLSIDRLVTKGERRRGYVILSFLTHAYIWGGERAAEVLPPSISKPLLQVSSCLELPPVATYAGLNLWNFTSLTADFANLDAIHALHTFTGTEDESWFYMVSVAMEAQAAYIIPIMLQALEAVERGDYATITHALKEMSCCIHKVGALLDRMDEKCDPMVFYYQIRPYLAGSKNMEAAGLPRGVFYDEGEGEGCWLQLRGGSNGQSSLIQFFDIVLGVEHTAHGNSTPDAPSNTSQTSFHEKVREYMPGPHRRFLEHVSRMGSIRDLAQEPATTAEQESFRCAFQDATRTLAEFRNMHLRIVTRYIVIPSRQPFTNGKLNLASAVMRVRDGAGHSSTELTGTGGTPLLPFLKQTRDETYEAGMLKAGT